MTTSIDFNEEYLRMHYKEMMAVDDAPLPIFLLSAFCPEIDDIVIDRVCSEGPDSLYGRLRSGYFDKEGESPFQNSARLLKEYVEKHPEHSELLK